MHPVVDGLREFDILLAVLLVLALGYEWVFHYRSRPKPIATLAAVGSWFLLVAGSLVTDLILMGRAFAPGLPFRLLGHMLGLTFVAVAYTMRQDGRSPLRD